MGATDEGALRLADDAIRRLVSDGAILRRERGGPLEIRYRSLLVLETLTRPWSAHGELWQQRNLTARLEAGKGLASSRSVHGTWNVEVVEALL